MCLQQEKGKNLKDNQYPHNIKTPSRGMSKVTPTPTQKHTCFVHIARNNVIQWKHDGKFKVNPEIMGSRMLQLVLVITQVH